MAEQSKKKKEERPTINKMSGKYNITGKIEAKNIQFGDQTNYYDQRQAIIQQIDTPAEFVAELENLRLQITALKNLPELSAEQAQTVQLVEEQVGQAIEEAQKPEPLAARITATLYSAQLVMDQLSQSVQSAVGLGVTLAMLGQLVLKVFVG